LTQYRIEVRLDECNACGVCYTLDPLHFEPGLDGKSHIVNGKTDTLTSQGVFDDTDIEGAHDVEAACPVSVITIIN
jgi:ferredoxin